jgi:hypothetical protein
MANPDALASDEHPDHVKPVDLAGPTVPVDPGESGPD